jgi:hypothetical protein
VAYASAEALAEHVQNRSMHKVQVAPYPECIALTSVCRSLKETLYTNYDNTFL